MSQTYTRQETIDKVNELLDPGKIDKLYDSEPVNWTGRTRDTEELYTEVIAEHLLKNLKSFDGISPIQRDSYRMGSHGTATLNLAKAGHTEDVFAKRLARLDLRDVGKVLDFQVPLKGERKDDAGKVDLISYNDERNELYLLELKIDGNNETLLRAMLESYTYYRIIYKKNLIEDFKNDLENNPYVIPAVLVTPGCNPYQELEDLDNRPRLKELAQKLGERLFMLSIQVNEAQL